MDNPAPGILTHGETNLTAGGIGAILVLGVLMLCLPRRHAMIPMLVLACFIPGQDLVILGLNFSGLRILVFFGSVRLLLQQFWKGFKWQRLDTLMVSYGIVATVVYVAQYGTFDALKFRSGQNYDIVGTYFLFRCFVRDWGDVFGVAKGFAVISVFVAAAFLEERATGRNMFAYFGGVPAITGMREGTLRCQGAFDHPILAGCFWASVLPIMGALYWRGGSNRWWGVAGVTCGLLIIYLCVSSTPAGTVIWIVVGVLAFPLRRSMRAVRWCIVGVLACLQLAMNGPIWGLIARVGLVNGSDAWHRFVVIDSFIRRFDEWWLAGINGQGLSGWGIYSNDITNQFVLEGIRGGLITLAIFVWLMVAAFSAVGTIWRTQVRERANLYMAWALGISILAHCVSFVGVSYFGEIWMLWYMALAIIGSMSVVRPAANCRSVPSRRTARRPAISAAKGSLIGLGDMAPT